MFRELEKVSLEDDRFDFLQVRGRRRYHDSCLLDNSREFAQCCYLLRRGLCKKEEQGQRFRYSQRLLFRARDVPDRWFP